MYIWLYVKYTNMSGGGGGWRKNDEIFMRFPGAPRFSVTNKNMIKKEMCSGKYVVHKSIKIYVYVHRSFE